METGKIVSVEGLPGSGKSTLTELMKKRYSVYPQTLTTLEDRAIGSAYDIVTKMLEGTKLAKQLIVSKQIWFLEKDIGKLEMAAQERALGKTVFIESGVPFTIYYCRYYKKRFFPSYEVVKKLWEKRKKETPTPDICVWIDSNHQSCIKRQLKRGKKIPPFFYTNFLKGIKEFTLNFWKRHYQDSKIQTVDASLSLENTIEQFNRVICGGGETVIKAIIFDADGTLFYGFRKSLGIKIALEKEGIERSEEDISKAYNEARNIIKQVRKMRYLKLGKAAYFLETAIWLHLLDAYSKDLALKINANWSKIMGKKIFPGVKTVLERLAKKYKLGLLTAGSELTYLPLIKNNKLSRLFSTIVAEDTLNQAKPAKKTYEETLKKLGVSKKEAVMVGNDLEKDYFIPKKFGLPAILIDRDGKTNRHVLKIRSLEDLEAKLKEI